MKSYYRKKIHILRDGKPCTYVVRITAKQHEEDPTTTKIVDAIENAQEFGRVEDVLAIVNNLLKNAKKYIREEA